MKKRCEWAKSDLMIDYHDTQWGVPLHDDNTLFEFIILDGAQAGLSWEIILKKRDGYREAFADFDPTVVARYTKRKQESLLKNPAIVRNRLKVASSIQNAKAFLKVQDEFGSFDKYIWQFVGHKTIRNRFKTLKDLPAQTAESKAMSKDLLKRDFKFVGPTICYAFMQAAGMVNDHLVTCFRHKEVVDSD